MRAKQGFTLPELLIVLALTVIVFSVLTPGIISIVGDARQSYLDGAANDIYMSEYAAALSQGRNADSDYSVFGDEYRDFGLSAVIIEYVNNSGIPHGVYVTDKLTPDELELAYLDGMLDDEKSRKKLRVGYWGGEVYAGTQEDFYDLVPTVTVHNGTDLFVEIVCGDMPKGLSDTDLKAKITLKNAHASHHPEEYYDTFADGEFKVKILLDSLLPDETRFGEKYPELRDGEVTAAIKILLVDQNGKEASGEYSVTFDPLFESRSDDNISISNARHLSNLRYICGDPDVTVRQTDDIEFSGIPKDDMCDGESHDVSIIRLPDFKGLYEGNGYVINDMSVASADGFSGLFESISGTVQDLHIVGGAPISVPDNGIAGVICRHLSENAELINCTVSEISISAGNGATVGGLAGNSEGRITRCSAILDDITLGSDCIFGGVAGSQINGKIDLSHTAGTVTSDSDSKICGIAPDAVSVFDCYSEITGKSLNGSAFYGVTDGTSTGSKYVLENAWIALDTNNSCQRDELEISQFVKNHSAYINGQKVSSAVFPPEIVTFNGETVRFGNTVFAKPCGLLGLLEVTFDGENYIYNLIYNFDAYDNESSIFPKPVWENPKTLETRYYAFYSDFAAPVGSDDGFEILTDGELSDAENVGNFICKEVKNFTEVKLRFAKAKRVYTAEFEDVKTGYVGVMAAYGVEEYDLFTDEFFFDIYKTYYCIDYESGSKGHFEMYNMTAFSLPEIDDLYFDIDTFGALEVYLFSTGELKMGQDWDIEMSDYTIGETIEYENLTLYKVEFGDAFYPVTMEFTTNSGFMLRADVKLEYGSDPYDSAPVIVELH